MSPLIWLLCKNGGNNPTSPFPSQCHDNQKEAVPKKPRGSGRSLIDTSIRIRGIGVNFDGLQKSANQLGLRYIWAARLNVFCPCLCVQSDLDSVERRIYGWTHAKLASPLSNQKIYVCVCIFLKENNISENILLL